MKRIIYFFAFSCLLLCGYGCKSVTYTQQERLQNKIPYLDPQIDWLSVETIYEDGKEVTSVKYTTERQVNHRNKPEVVRTYEGEKSYVKNPRIKEITDYCISTTRKQICSLDDVAYGKIVWSIEQDKSYKEAELLGALASISLYTLSMLGMPGEIEACTCKIKCAIFDSNDIFVAEYEGEATCKYRVAMYYGYRSKDAKQMAKTNAKVEAVNSILAQINQDAAFLTKRLLNYRH